MIRVYLDSNVFRNLKNSSSSQYKKLRMDLNNFSSSFLHCFSHAHLSDLQRDKTDAKFDDLAFMESFVRDNYLCHYWGDLHAQPYLATPLKAFNDLDPADRPLESYLDFDEMFDTPSLKEPAKQLKSLLTSTKFSFPVPNLEEQPQDIREALSQVIPSGKNELTMMDWIEHFLKMSDRLMDDDGPYKALRHVSSKYIGKEKWDIDINNVNFDEDFKNSPMQKTFTEFVNSSLNPNGDKKVSDYDFLTNAFTSLNILGLDKEKNKKAKFMNTLNDAQHSYYGAHCDYVVSDDQGFLLKSKVLYKLLGIGTIVLNTDEFCNSINIIGAIKESDVTAFTKLLAFDLKTGIVLNSKPSIMYDRMTTVIKPNHTYLGYFNQVRHIRDNQRENYIVLTNESNNYSDFTFYKEFEIVTNKAIDLFGVDIEFKGAYLHEDTEQIKSGKWDGRRWRLTDTYLTLEINEGTKKFNLVIGPLLID